MRGYEKSEYLETKRQESIAYLKSVGKYIGEPGCKWRPRKAAQTDVAKTWAEARKREGVK